MAPQRGGSGRIQGKGMKTNGDGLAGTGQGVAPRARATSGRVGVGRYASPNEGGRACGGGVNGPDPGEGEEADEGGPVAGVVGGWVLDPDTGGHQEQRKGGQAQDVDGHGLRRGAGPPEAALRLGRHSGPPLQASGGPQVAGEREKRMGMIMA